MSQGMLEVSYGKKMRYSTHKTCFDQLYLPQLSNRGFLGITARNSDRHQKSVDVNIVKVMNMDPNFYIERDPEEQEPAVDQNQQ